MINRCIMIFPKFINIGLIQDIRKKYDPLYEHVGPHITLVFPFTSHISKSEMEKHIKKAVRHIRPFQLVMHGISKEESNYLFLNVREGIEQLVEIHRRLYTGLLSSLYPPFLHSNAYKPHLTLGKTLNEELLEDAFGTCKLVDDFFIDYIEELTIEIIEENEDSRMESTIKL